MVIKIGGSTLEDIGALSGLWRAVGEVARRTPLVLVHGGGKAVDALVGRLGLPVERREGLRVTPADQIGLIAGVLAGDVNKRLVGAINAAGGRSVGLCLGDGGMVECARLTRSASGAALDLGRVGEVTGGRAELARTLLDAGYLPVVSSIGIDGTGGLLNVNADDAAAALARALGATHLVLLTDVPGVKGADGRVVPTLGAGEAERLIAAGVIAGGMAVKVRSALAAAAGLPGGEGTGGGRVVIMSGERADDLAAYLAGSPVGTTVTA